MYIFFSTSSQKEMQREKEEKLVIKESRRIIFELIIRKSFSKARHAFATTIRYHISAHEVVEIYNILIYLSLKLMPHFYVHMQTEL